MRFYENSKFIKVIFSFILTISLFSSAAYSFDKNFVAYESAKVHFKKGISHFNKMHYLAAVEYFRRAVARYPDYYIARDFLARAYLFAGYKDAALVEYENLYQLTPDNLSVLSKIEYLRYEQSNPTKKLNFSQLLLNDIYRSKEFKKYKFEAPIDLVVDNKKNLYVTSFNSGRIIKIDQYGKGVKIFKPSFSAKLFGLDIHNEKIVTVDYENDCVYLLNSSLKKIRLFGETGSKNGKFHGPKGVCFNENGKIYVVDSGNNRIQKFNKKGRFILSFGKKGEKGGELNNPSDIVVVNGIVYVSDYGNKRISCFDETGNFLYNLPISKLNQPRGISYLNGSLLISDSKIGLVKFDILTKSYERFLTWSDGEGEFSRLFASTVDQDGYLYCLDHNLQSIYTFAPASKKYSNLNLEITSIDTSQFPVVALYTNVRNRDGSPLYGLKRGNFYLKEDDSSIINHSVSYLKNKTKSVSISFCVDRSMQNKKNHEDLGWVSDFILRKMKKNDRLKITNFNQDVWQGLKFDWSRRRILKALKSKEYGKGKNIGSTLYNSISDLVAKINNRSVILLTDGKVLSDSFSRYSVDNVIDYAKKHYIPINIITFGKADYKLKRIANETGGKLIRSNNIKELKKVYTRIKKMKEYRYVIVYNSYKKKQSKNWWVDLKVDILHKGQKGIEWSGYFVPE